MEIGPSRFTVFPVDLFLVGDFRGNLDVGSQTLSSAGNNDFFLTKLMMML